MSSKAIQCQKIFVKLCTVCGAGILADNQFCRQCGALQADELISDEFSSQPTVSLSSTNEGERSPSLPATTVDAPSLTYTTTLLDDAFYHSVSTPLIKTATATLTSQQTGQLHNRWSKTLMLALILVPI